MAQITAIKEDILPYQIKEEYYHKQRVISRNIGGSM
jgi:hypothetical protein